MKRLLSILLLTLALTAPALAQEATPQATIAPTPAPTLVVTEAPPVVVPPAPVETPALSPVMILAVVMIVVSMGGLLFSVYLHFKQTGNFQDSYTMLVQGIVSNVGLTNVLQSGYAGLQPEQRKWADLGLSLADALSRATADQRDDVIQTWTARIRDMAANQSAKNG